MEAAMDLMRRIPPNETETALSALLPEQSSDLLSQVDQPLKIALSNKNQPTLEDGYFPSAYLRKLEVEANDVFAVYRDQYYEGGISSVYMWECDGGGFVACFLVKKDGSKSAHGRRGYLQEGAWDAIHVIEVAWLGVGEEGTAHNCLTSTIMLSLTTSAKSAGSFNLSGSSRRQLNLDPSAEDGHMCNMGKMIEEMEGKLRNSLDQVYLGKTKEMVYMHSLTTAPRSTNATSKETTELPTVSCGLLEIK